MLATPKHMRHALAVIRHLHVRELVVDERLACWRVKRMVYTLAAVLPRVVQSNPVVSKLQQRCVHSIDLVVCTRGCGCSVGVVVSSSGCGGCSGSGSGSGCVRVRVRVCVCQCAVDNNSLSTV